MGHQFTLVREENIPELRSIARLYRHATTGARLLSIINDNENKCFSIGFRTPPGSSNGVAHILEHSVLSGSQKYPVKEAFVELMKGSLATFINAFTFPDKTCYPLASQNIQDFYNLIDVYMDAVLHPLINPMAFQQEGWHYEIEQPDDPLVYKGVVFNEMKGALSAPERIQEEAIVASLFPGHVYGYNSGGNPEEIVGLTYEEFKRFHDTHYHPSNAWIFFYGNDDPEKRLELMDTYIGSYKAIAIDSSIPPIRTLKEPQAMQVGYDAGADTGEGKKSYFTMSWVLPDKSDPLLTFSFDILGHILIGTPASPLRKALIDSSLGEDLTGLGLENVEHRNLLFSTGLKGIAATDAEKVKQLILGTLSKLVEQGIDEEMIEAALNTVEFNLREQNTGGLPQGLDLMIRVMTTWLYDGDPLVPALFEKPFQVIREKLKTDRRYFEGLIRKYLLENPFRVEVLMSPDSGIARQREEVEKANLENVKTGLTDTDITRLIAATRALKQRQETPDTPEALGSLPILKLGDLEKKIKTIPLTLKKCQGVDVLYHDIFTNGIIYLDLGFDLARLPVELLPLTEVFGRALLEMGTAREDFVKLSQRIGRHTGGIESRLVCANAYLKPDAVTRLFLRAKATLTNAKQLSSILKDILLTANFNNPERFKQIVLEQKAGIESQLGRRGDVYAVRRMQAQFTAAGWAEEQMSGVTALFHLRQLVAEIDKDWPSVLERLERMHRLLINRGGLVCNATLAEDDWRTFLPRLEELLGDLPEQDVQLSHWELKLPDRREGLVIPSQVNYVGQTFNLFDTGYRLNGSLEAVIQYLRMTYLWEKIRAQGGAYGAFCELDSNAGLIQLISFRDPNLAGTLDVYAHMTDFLKDLDEKRLSSGELLKSIIGAIGLLDAYQLPDAKGFTSLLRHLTGKTDEARQVYRDQLLSTTVEDFHKLGKVLEDAIQSGVIVAVGAREALEKSGLSLEITPVL